MFELSKQVIKMTGELQDKTKELDEKDKQMNSLVAAIRNAVEDPQALNEILTTFE